MASPNPSAMLAESLSTFSKAAYQAFAEVEAQSRLEVARMGVEVREAKADRDKAIRELHTFQLEAQGWKQEIVTTKAALSQAELTIAHQAETLAAQVETITQLRREVTQWKDQSRNWQEHFLRVEQERCAQLSRIDELVVEKLQLPQMISSTSLQTPKSIKYANSSKSAPSSSSKWPSDTTTSPTQAPAPPSPSSLDSSAITPGAQPGSSTNAQRRKRGAKSQIERERDIPPMQVSNDKEEGSSTGVKRRRKNHAPTAQGPAATAAQPKQDAPAAVRSSTVIRRVQAIVHVKREESYSDEEASLRKGTGAASTSQNAAASSVAIKKKEESAEYQRFLRTPRRNIIEDEPEDEERHCEEEDEREIRDQIVASGSDPLFDSGHPRQQGAQRSRFRQRGRINYREDDDCEEVEDEDDDDELMMGAEDNHDEVYGTQRVEPTLETHRSSKKNPSNAGLPPKKRKVTGR